MQDPSQALAGLARGMCADGSARDARLDARLPLRVVAEMIGVSFSILARYERGERPLTDARAVIYGGVLAQLSRKP